MIIKDKTDLKDIVKAISEALSIRKIKVKHQHLYEIFAQSQEFKTDAALRAAMPVIVEKYRANELIVPLIKKYAVLESENSSVPNSLIEDVVYKVKPFPVIPYNNYFIEIRIDWNDGFVSKPYYVHQSQLNSSSYSEAYGHCTTYRLNSWALFEHEYDSLIDLIRENVQSVVNGYTDNGYEEYASFTDNANDSLDSIHQLIQHFDYENHSAGGDVISVLDIFYNDDSVYQPHIHELGLTEVTIDGKLLLDYSFSNIQIRQLTAKELLSNPGFLVNDEALYFELLDLRDTCLSNYEEKNLEFS